MCASVTCVSRYVSVCGCESVSGCVSKDGVLYLRVCKFYELLYQDHPYLLPFQTMK